MARGRTRTEVEAGTRHGMLVTTGNCRKAPRNLLWECRCDCGKVVWRTSTQLASGIVSCGCVRRHGGGRKRMPKTDHQAERLSYNQRVGERFNDWWMFGDDKAVRRLFKMFR